MEDGLDDQDSILGSVRFFFDPLTRLRQLWKIPTLLFKAAET